MPEAGPRESTHPLRDAGLAVALLTVVPVGVRWPEKGRVDVAGWFPLVGLGLGGLTYGALLLARPYADAGRASLIAALLVAALALVTRFIHHDGLADTADAWWGGATPERRLAIMSDSATGAFGATAVALAVVIHVAAFAALLDGGLLVATLIAPVAGRFAATCAAWLGSPAREGGLGRSVMRRPTVFGLFVAALTLAAVGAVAWMLGGRAALALLTFGLVAALGVPHVIAGRMGGVTGDVMGASVIVVETLVLAAAPFVG